MKKDVCFLLLLLCTQITLSAQELVRMNKQGVLLSAKTNKEVSFFGVNYCLPSASDFRMAGLVSTDRKKMIDQDMVHLKRMGFDALRISFWGDYENADLQGNLLDNEHLDLLDYLIYKATLSEMKILFSPIVTHSANWPDKYHLNDMPGFSAHTEKWKLTIDSAAIAAQRNYMNQILNHQNRYSGKLLKNEPTIIGIEIINEPTHVTDKLKETTNYINAMHETIRATGCKKVICYNISQDFKIANAIVKSKAEGVTYGWYPTQLNIGYTLEGNFLPYVSSYHQMSTINTGNRSKWIYEFDAPDLSVSYMYPAMVREYRKGGAQFAAMFSYDMLATAAYNLGWQTHNLNMVYTPSKAVSAIIAAKAMKLLPRGGDYGIFPQNNTFGPFKVNYEKNLSVYADDKHLFYSNSIDSTDVIHSSNLEQIVGCGSSPVVNTDAKGIYFLEKVSEGIWRLELYPDAIEVSDPFLMPNKNKVTHVLNSRPVQFTFNLPGITANAHIFNAHSENFTGRLQNRSTSLLPGLYFISDKEKIDFNALPALVNGVKLQEMVLPEIMPAKDYFIHQAQSEYTLEGGVSIDCKITDMAATSNVALYYKINGRYFKKRVMEMIQPYHFQAKLSLSDFQETDQTNADNSSNSFLLEYIITVTQNNITTMYPSGINGTPFDWDFYSNKDVYVSKVINPVSKLNVLDIELDKDKLRKTRVFKSVPYDYKMVMNTLSNRLCLQVKCDNLITNPENWYPNDISFSHFIQHKLKARIDAGAIPTWLEIKARKITETTDAILIGFNQSDGTCWGAKVALTSEFETIRIPVSDLRPVPMAMLPQDWPGVNPYFYPSVSGSQKPEWAKIENIFISIRDDLYPQSLSAPKGYEIQSVELFF